MMKCILPIDRKIRNTQYFHKFQNGSNPKHTYRITPRGDKVSMLTHVYPHKARRKIEVIICKITRLTAHFMRGLMFDLLILHLLIKSMVIHHTEYFFGELIQNIFTLPRIHSCNNLKLKLVCPDEMFLGIPIIQQ